MDSVVGVKASVREVPKEDLDFLRDIILPNQVNWGLVYKLFLSTS